MEGLEGMGNVSLFFSFVGKLDAVFFISWVIALFWPLLAFWLFSPLTCLFICIFSMFCENKDMICHSFIIIYAMPKT